jgi:hypothetical protein
MVIIEFSKDPHTESDGQSFVVPTPQDEAIPKVNCGPADHKSLITRLLSVVQRPTPGKNAHFEGE